jgi:hypothetical protein
MSEDADHRDYDVGYRKPPKHSRFPPGQSGNSKGRPPKSRNSATIIREALSEKVVVRGSNRKMSKLEVSMAQLANKAAGGDLKAIAMVLGLYRDIEAGAAASGQRAEAPLDHADREILEMLLQKVRAASEASGGK